MKNSNQNTQETATKKLTLKQILKRIEQGKFSEILDQNPMDYEGTKADKFQEEQALKSVLFLKDSGFEIDDSVLALAIFQNNNEIRNAIKNKIFTIAKDKEKDGFYYMFENLSDMESLSLIRDGLTRVYNGVMKYKHRKSSIPKGRMIEVEIDGKRFIVDENQVKFLKFHISNREHLIAEIKEIAVPLETAMVL